MRRVMANEEQLYRLQRTEYMDWYVVAQSPSDPQ